MTAVGDIVILQGFINQPWEITHLFGGEYAVRRALVKHRSLVANVQVADLTAYILNATSPEVREFIAAYEANQRIAGRWCYDRVIAETRRKYVLVDETTDSGVSRSGRFMIDRETGYVYAIRGYGKRGHLVSTSLTKMTADYRKATATFDPTKRWHTQTGRGRLNATA